MPEVAPDVFRVRSRRVNCYLVRDGSSLTLVDSGLPEHWAAIKSSCDALGLDVSAIEAVLLTHVHSDHAGSAERARVEAAAAIRLHPDDAELADGRTHRRNERPVAAYLWRPAAVAAMWELIAGGGLRMPGLGGYSQLSHGDRLEVPGCPTWSGFLATRAAASDLSCLTAMSASAVTPWSRSTCSPATGAPVCSAGHSWRTAGRLFPHSIVSPI